MLRLFFNRNSLFVKTAFWGSALLTLFFFLKGGWGTLTFFQKILWILALAQILFAKGVDLYPWYPKEARGPGIGLQFHKAIVPVSYLWLSFILLVWYRPLTPVLLFYNILLLPIGFVACILIFFHFRDPDRAHPNILSGSPREGAKDAKNALLLAKSPVSPPPSLLQ